MSLGPRPTSLTNGILIHPAIWPQQIWSENWGRLCPFVEGELATLCQLSSQRGQGRGLYLRAKFHLDPSNKLETEPRISKYATVNWVIIHSTLLTVTADGYIWFTKLKRTNHNESIESGRQIERRLIIFRRTCTPAILFYTYSGPSNFGSFGQIFWRILLPYSC